MRYHIKNEAGKIIASFMYECDRSYSLDVLNEMFPDCELTEYDD